MFNNEVVTLGVNQVEGVFPEAGSAGGGEVFRGPVPAAQPRPRTKKSQPKSCARARSECCETYVSNAGSNVDGGKVRGRRPGWNDTSVRSTVIVAFNTPEPSRDPESFLKALVSALRSDQLCRNQGSQFFRWQTGLGSCPTPRCRVGYS